jgi:hypothetical protein
MFRHAHLLMQPLHNSSTCSISLETATHSCSTCTCAYHALLCCCILQVVFNGRLLDSLTGQEYHDTIRIASESVSGVQEPPLELWVHARPPKAHLQVQGDLQFGVVPVGSKARKVVQLVNRGSAAADYTITWDR